jgi:hypothetical protein
MTNRCEETNCTRYINGERFCNWNPKTCPFLKAIDSEALKIEDEAKNAMLEAAKAGREAAAEPDEPRTWRATVSVITTGDTIEDAILNLKNSRMRHDDILEGPVADPLPNLTGYGREKYLSELKRIIEGSTLWRKF